jgi:hypothetical protein
MPGVDAFVLTYAAKQAQIAFEFENRQGRRTKYATNAASGRQEG